MIDTSNLVTNYITSMFIDVNKFITCVYNYNYYYNLLIHFRTDWSLFLPGDNWQILQALSLNPCEGHRTAIKGIKSTTDS